LTKLSFTASLQSLDLNAHTAKFYLMNTSRNRNNWRVTVTSLSEALPTLKGVPLGLGSGYKPGHFSDSMDSGTFIDYEMPGTYALGTAKVEDTKTWSMMKAGELGPVSVVIAVYRDVCSACGESLADYQDSWAEHPCIKQGKGYSQVESFKFSRVEFVPEPAYPQAGILEMSAQLRDRSVPLELCAAYYEGQPSEKLASAVQEMRSRLGFANQEDTNLEAAIKNCRVKLGFPERIEA